MLLPFLVRRSAFLIACAPLKAAPVLFVIHSLSFWLCFCIDRLLAMLQLTPLPLSCKCYATAGVCSSIVFHLGRGGDRRGAGSKKQRHSSVRYPFSLSFISSSLSPCCSSFLRSPPSYRYCAAPSSFFARRCGICSISLCVTASIDTFFCFVLLLCPRPLKLAFVAVCPPIFLFALNVAHLRWYFQA